MAPSVQRDQRRDHEPRREHGHGDLQTLLVQLQAIEGSETIPVVRVQWNDPAIIKRVLDMGAYGVMVPWIGGRAEAGLHAREPTG